MNRIAFALALLVIPPTSTAFENPLPEWIDYKLYALGIPMVNTRLALEIDDQDQYHYSVTSRPIGVLDFFTDFEIVERSMGDATRTGYRPEVWKFEYRRGDETGTDQLDFNWEEDAVSGIYKGEPVEFDLEPGTIDRTILHVAIITDLRNGKRELNYTSAGRKIKHYHYKVTAEETLQTSIGEVKTLKVQRFKDGEPHRTTLWCAPELDYIPVRAEQGEGGLTYTLEIVGISDQSTAPAIQARASTPNGNSLPAQP